MLGWVRSGAVRIIYAQALDWLFPPRCAGCKRLGTHWCNDCNANARRIVEPYCHVCGFPLQATQDCPICKHQRFAFDAARSWARYEGNLRQAILSLKHRRNELLAAQLSRSLTGALEADWRIDLIVPVPLAPQRLAERGYNQADMLAAGLSASFAHPVANSALSRQHETLPQVGLNPGQRRKNLRGAFIADRSLVEGRNILVLDDIMTTGATLDAAAHALKHARAANVYALSLARTMLERDQMFW
jgi:ComF family protein